MYVQRILKNSARGYQTMNSGLPNSIFQHDKMTIDELRDILPPFEILDEVPLTCQGNYILSLGASEISHGKT